MNRFTYEQFTRTIIQNLAGDARVLGLIAAGSTAAGIATGDGTPSRQPDQWSDHDLLLITIPGEQDTFRLGQFWLPEPDRIVLNFQETEHARNILYDDGHLVEAAVFDPDEMHVMRINAYQVLLDRANLTGSLDITQRMTEIKAATDRWTAQHTSTDEYLSGKFLVNLLVGVNRYRRGEVISATAFVKSYSLDHLLPLLVRYGADFEDAPPDRALIDNLDPLRRFEFAFPKLGALVNALLKQDIPAAATGLLLLAERVLCDQMVDYPRDAVAMVREVVSGSPNAGD